MFEIVVSEKQSFMGLEIPVITGGFGEKEKCLDDKKIAEIHGMKLIHVRENINNHRKEFEDKVDIIDLKVIGNTDNNLELLKTLGYNKMQVSKSKNIYLLSQRGYMKLIKILDSERSWYIYNQLINEYFQMREIIQTGSTIATISDETIKKITDPLYLMIQQQSESWNTIAKTVEIVASNQKKQGEETKELKEEIKKLEAKIVQESSIKKFEVLAEKQFKEQCKTDTRTMRNQFMADVDVKCTHLDRALKPAELAKYYKKDSKEFNSWLQSIGLQYKEAGCWVIAQKYKDQGYSDTFVGPYGTYLGWTLKGCILIYDLLAARGKYPQIQEAFEQ